MHRYFAIAAVCLVPAFASAQEMDLDGMQESLSMLEQTAATALADYNIDANPSDLTIGQLAQIHGILTSTEDEASKEERISAIVNE